MNDDAYIQPFFLYAEHNYKYNSQAACYSDKQENPPQKLMQFVRMPTNGWFSSHLMERPRHKAIEFLREICTEID